MISIAEKVAKQINKLSIPAAIIIASVILGGFYYATQASKQKSIVRQQEAKTEQEENFTTKISKKDELVLEGLINDYLHRKKIKSPALFSSINTYTNVSLGDIIVYIYVQDEQLNPGQFKILEEIITREINDSLLSWDDFGWAREYKITIVLRP